MNAPLHAMGPDVDPRPESGLPYDDEEPGADFFAQVLGLLAIVRRRWLVVVVTLVLCLAGAALALKLLHPRWRAKATILLHMSGPQVMDKVQGVSADQEERGTDYRDYYETQRQIMGSRAVAERALSELGLAHDPVFLGIGDVQSEAERLALAARIDPVERLRELVMVTEIRDSRLVAVAAEYGDPEVASELANAVADAYLQHVQTTRARLGVNAQADIAEEKAKAQLRLDAAEKAFEDFKHENALTSIVHLEEHATQGILTLYEHSKQLEAERIRLESLVEEAERLHGAGNLAASNLLSESDRVLFRRMREEGLEADRAFAEVDVQYGPRHEEHRKAKRRLDIIDGKIEREGDELIESLAARLNVARKAERRLNGSLGREKSRALRVNDLERAYKVLERDAATAAEEYMLIARRDTEIAITNRVEEEGIEILDRATSPTSAVFPKKLLVFGVALAAGLGFGVVLALGIDFRDQRIRGRVDLERALSAFGLPLLGQLPQLPSDTKLGAGNVRAQRRQRDLYAHLFPHSMMAERCRGVRTALAFGSSGQHLRSILITSPNSAEGKSSTAVNLALSFCQANKRVVLIDADMRRPRLHMVFPEAADAGDRGLAAILADRCDLESAMLVASADAPENLLILPCGDVPSNPAELVDSPAFRRLLLELQERCDLVIVDCPPVLPVTDPTILARHVDGVVLVGRAGSTRRGEMQAAIAQLARSDTNVVGVVLNEVDTRRDRYGYGGEYYTYRAIPRPEPEPT